MLKSTVIGGGLFGLVAGLPVVGMLNCACCSLVAGGGFLAAYLYSKECAGQGFAFRPGNGALVGLVAGLFYAIASTVIGAIVNAVTGGLDVETILDQMQQTDAPPEVVDGIANALDMLSGPAGILVVFFVSLLLAAIFSTLGGLIGGSVFKVESAAPPPAGGDVPPPPPPPTV